MHPWNYEGFWQKVKIYIGYGNRLGDNDPLLPFWYFHALELLARGALAQVHPILLADVQDENNILSAFDRPHTSTKLTSISVSLVFKRCQSFIKDFTAADYHKCLEWMQLIALDVATSELIFHDLQPRQWLGDYYRISQILLDFQGKTLSEYLGFINAEKAKRTITAFEEDLISQVEAAMQKARVYYAQFTRAELAAKYSLFEDKFNAADECTRKKMRCPVCGSPGILQGEIVEYGNFQIIDVEPYLVRDVRVLPTQFDCVYCHFALDNYVAMDIAGMGTEYTLAIPGQMGIDVVDESDIDEFTMLDV
jgi:hypothetical protein